MERSALLAEEVLDVHRNIVTSGNKILATFCRVWPIGEYRRFRWPTWQVWVFLLRLAHSLLRYVPQPALRRIQCLS